MKRKKVSFVGIILLVLLLVVAGGIWYWNTHKKQIIRSKLENAIREKSKGLYKVHYDSLDMDEISGNLSVSSFTLSYDSIKYEQLKKEKKAPFLLFNISIPQIKITGVETPRALIDKEISGKHLEIIRPVIEILYTNAGKDSSRHLPDKEIYEQILGNLDLIKMDSVTISGAEIITKNLSDDKTLVHVFNTSISLLRVAVDSTAGADTTRLLFAKEINFDCEKITWQSSNKFYNNQVDSLTFRSAESNISMKDFLIIPVMGENEFNRNIRVQTDRFDFAIRNIQLKNTDFYQLTDEVIKADSLLIGSASFKIYRDRTLPPDNKNRVGGYPHQLIQQMAVRLDIKKGIIRNTYIEYKEKSPITNQYGKIQFGNSYANISNITNRKESIEKNNLMVFDIQTHFLNKIPLLAKWTFYLGNSNGRFDVQGKMGHADARIFNPIAQPLGPALFKSGNVNSLEFALAGTNYQMKGDVKILYDDLHVSLLKKDADSIHFNKRKVMSLLANMKIKNANPEKGKDPRTADVIYQRDIHKSIFNLLWKSIFAGLQEVSGVK